MCIVKAPSVVPAGKEKEPAIIRNPYLDGLDPASKALRTGRSALRIERRAPGDPAQASGPGGTIVRPTTANPAPALPAVLPSDSLGISRGFATDFR